MKVSHELWVYCKQGVEPDAGLSRLTCNREQRAMQTLYTQEEIRPEWTHLGITAEQNLTDETREAKRYISHTHTHTRQETIKTEQEVTHTYAEI